MAYQCPLCRCPLRRVDRSFSCQNNHQFDVAKEGYVNLMPVQHKGSKHPGDNREMMQARRRFLESGPYEPLRQAVVEVCQEALPADGRAEQGVTLLDIGCGEGYYTSGLAEHYVGGGEAGCSQVYGLDISKVAVRYAAKRYPQGQFCVGSSHRLPFADGGLDGVVRIYAPCHAQELARCVTPGGILLTVTPAARHLYQLRALVYEQVRLHDEQPEELVGFALEKERTLSYVLSLGSEQALDLLHMTPFGWKANADVIGDLEEMDFFACEADFIIRIYRKAFG